VEVQRQYEEIYGTKLEDLQEVKIYGGIIMPEIKRMTRTYEKREKERRKSRGRELSSSSSSEDEVKKSVHKSRTVSLTGPCLSYSVEYELANQTLIVTVIGARNLKNSDLMGGKTDTIVHVRLGEMEMKTKVVKDNNNPDIGETFRFPMYMGDSQRMASKLVFQVFDWDRFSKNDSLGEVVVPLGQIDLTDRNPKWAVLQPIMKKVESANSGSTFI